MKFLDLLRLYGTDEKYREASALLIKLLRARRLNYWEPDDPIIRSERRLLIGVVMWSAYDRKLLDDVNNILEQKKASLEELNVEVFDFSACISQDSFERYIPDVDIKSVFQTPIIGLWVKGTLQKVEQGYDARTSVTELVKSVWPIEMANGVAAIASVAAR